MGSRRPGKPAVLVAVAGVLIIVGGAMAANATLPSSSGCPAQKVVSCRALAAEQEGVPSPPRPVYVNGPSVTTGPEFFKSGISDIRQPPIPSPTFAQVNEWTGSIVGTRVQVGAGSVAGTNRGELLEVRGTSPRPIITFDDVVGGPFRVIASSGVVLTVQGASGKEFTYNAATESLVGS